MNPQRPCRDCGRQTVNEAYLFIASPYRKIILPSRAQVWSCGLALANDVRVEVMSSISRQNFLRASDGRHILFPSALWLVMSLASCSTNGGLGVTKTGNMNTANVSGHVEHSGKESCFSV